MSAVRCWRRRNVVEAGRAVMARRSRNGGTMGAVLKVVKRVLRVGAESMTKVGCDVTKSQAQEVIDATVGWEFLNEERGSK
ncbi:hypothetical protein TSMEX_009678 [Taenia solium]|eukprot:TsM_001035800 transcript=TsM_001035800 gene=TsM_001035800